MTTLVNNVQLFKGFYYKINVTGKRYTMDTLAIIDPDADDKICTWLVAHSSLGWFTK